MKRFYFFSFILAIGVILSACGTTENQDKADSSKQTNQQENDSSSNDGNTSEQSSKKDQSGGDGENMDLASEVDHVISSVEQLDKTLKNSANDVQSINNQGKTLEENWDSIEKQVEEQFPNQYKKVEESLYPLIGAAKKEDPNIEKMKKWAQTTVESLNELKQKIESQ
ncbi:hypothetical protein [Halobacillus naozhouensis]|uniref:Lipoprotein n=1 Tax=Halobacillus naozhouensis TaxID=554880 RepID=A0ABY8IXF4_9BACI|nr:hypothetical protein [Halobacillus naozhouensis]WFT74512.1 hypothetical protein P9989_19510 [Halobacillus naozhouensis]